ncbi:tetratricopeptide repeat protein [Leptolyngbyaceae cyanobacterium UHCC 1019]
MTPKEEVYQKLRQWQTALRLTDSDTGLFDAEPSTSRLQPKSRQNDLKLYEQLLERMLAEAIARQSGLRESDRHELQALKQVLHLANDDVAEIERRVTTQSAQSAATVLPTAFSKENDTPTSQPLSFHPSTAIPSTEIPSVQIPSTEIPPVHIPSAEIPSAQIPSTENLSAENPSAAGEVNPSANLTGVKGQVVKRKADMEGISMPASPAQPDQSASQKNVSQPVTEISTGAAISADQTADSTAKSSSSLKSQAANAEKPPLIVKRDRRPLFITLGLLLPLLGIVGGIWLSLRPNLWNTVPADPKLAQQFVETGTQKNQQGQYAAAIQDFDQAIRFNPQDATAFLNRGFAQHRVGNLNAAVDDYTKALAIDNQLAEAFSNRSHARFDQGKPDEALKDAAQAIALQPKLAVAHLNLGNALFAKGNLDGAFQKFTETIQLNPANTVTARAHNNQGNVFAKQNKLDEAIQAYTQAIQLDDTYADALFNRALAFEQKGNQQGAIDDLRAAANLYKAAGNTGMTETANRRIEQLQKKPAPAPAPAPTSSTQAI